jgi:hypothetical protein
MFDETSSSCLPGRKLSASYGISELELHHFGGLAGLRKHGHYKEVRLVDPFSGGAMLHFPSTLHADNWLVSCFTRSLACTVPVEPLQAMERGKLLTSRCSLILMTPQGTVADLVVSTFDGKARQDWGQFQIVVAALGLRPQLRAREDIRANPMYVRNLDRMRQQLVQGIGDATKAAARIRVKRIVEERGHLSLAELVELASNRSFTRQAVECALISLYRSQEVGMNTTEAVYGDDASIQLL